MSRISSLLLVVFALLSVSTAAVAQDNEAPAEPVTQSLKGLYGITTTNIMATAEMLDEEQYAYQPTDDVRSAGGILAHIADAQYAFCSAAAGEASPNEANMEGTDATKEVIVAALSGAFAYCNGVYDAMTDEDGAVMQNFFGNQMAAAGIMAFNSAHNYEHYGNLVTYMRMNGIVPPSSM